MGDYADAVIYGDTCPCGQYLGNGPGFTQYCSKQCARDYGPQAGDADFEGGPDDCPHCSKSFRCSHSRNQHIRAKHPEVCCPCCSKVCATMQGVNNHVHAKHPEAEGFNRIPPAGDR
jgi:hypothetical protein